MFLNFSFQNLSQFISTAFTCKTDVSTMPQKHMRNINVVYIFSSPLLSYFSPSRIVTNILSSRNIIMIKELCTFVSLQYTRGGTYRREEKAAVHLEPYTLPTDTHVGCRRGGGKYCYEPAFTYDPGVTLFLLEECCFFLAPSWVTFPKIMGQNVRCKELPIYQRFFSYNLWNPIAKRVCSICLSW
jgi:hypothetical protein